MKKKIFILIILKAIPLISQSKTEILNNRQYALEKIYWTLGAASVGNVWINRGFFFKNWYDKDKKKRLEEKKKKIGISWIFVSALSGLFLCMIKQKIKN